ncbi:hypothetical protein MMC13_002932 [Lambiella insularis]|nr:hypothetical protein [Lambiella insularis]
MFSKVLLLICTLLALGFSTRASVPSPQAHIDLVCHTSHASECYPRTFQPSESFQLVHDEQDLPSGLHVRLDLMTGKKEAKLNVAGENDQELLARPMDVVIVDPPEPAHAISGPLQRAQKLLTKPEEQGSIRPPASKSAEGTSFEASKKKFTATSTDKPEVLMSAMETLEDLSHDIYWGLKLAQDSDVVVKLFNILSHNISDSSTKGAAALVFGTAIQNNPAAFSAALSHFYNDNLPTGPMEAVLLAMIHEQLPQILTRYVYLLSALLQDSTHFWKFVNSDGLETLKVIFDPEQAGKDGKDRLRGKIANFVLDHFLQQDSLAKTQKAPDDFPTEQEDAWVFPNPSEVEGSYQWPHDKNPTFSPFNLIEKFHPWCSVLKTSIKAWKSAKSRPSAFENVEEAHEALKEKLDALGRDC